MAHYSLMVGGSVRHNVRGKFMLMHSFRVGVAAATLAVLSTALAGGASAANLVQNGDFNSPGANQAQLLSGGDS
jgi:hypothetical protein